LKGIKRRTYSRNTSRTRVRKEYGADVFRDGLRVELRQLGELKTHENFVREEGG